MCPSPDVYTAKKSCREGPAMTNRLTAILSILVILGFGAPLPAENPAASTEEIRAAVAKSLPLLAKGAKGHIEQRTCFACHSQGLPILALTTAKPRGFEVNDDDVRKQLQFIADFLSKNRDNYNKGRGT